MKKGLDEIKEKALIADVFIVVLDARAPLSTYNFEFDKISPNKPRLIVLTKIDLADKPKALRLVKQHFANNKNIVVSVNLKEQNSKKIILNSLKKLQQIKKEQNLKKGILNSQLRAFVVGIPNSGKSTLINLLANSKVKTGNMPGITRAQQWISTDNLMLLDTPGILWPKFDNQENAFKLVAIGSIKQELLPLNFLFETSYKLLSRLYPTRIEELKLKPSFDDVEIQKNLIQLAENLHFYKTKNSKNKSEEKEFDLNRTMQWFINHIKKINNLTFD